VAGRPSVVAAPSFGRPPLLLDRARPRRRAPPPHLLERAGRERCSGAKRFESDRFGVNRPRNMVWGRIQPWPPLEAERPTTGIWCHA